MVVVFIGLVFISIKLGVEETFSQEMLWQIILFLLAFESTNAERPTGSVMIVHCIKNAIQTDPSVDTNLKLILTIQLTQFMCYINLFDKSLKIISRIREKKDYTKPFKFRVVMSK